MRCANESRGFCRGAGRPLSADTFPAAMEGMAEIVAGAYVSVPKHIADINADVEIVKCRGVEIQFHSALVHGASPLSMDWTQE